MGSIIISLLINLFGLTGLALFYVQKRAKEIAIRKVLGASPGRIILLFSKEI